MEKPVFVRSLVAVIVVVIIVAGGFLLTRKDDSSLLPQPQIKTTEEKVPSTITKTYTDEAGFSFNYPDDLTVAKKESTSSAVYSNIELTSEQVAGSLTFLVEDTKEKTIDADSSATKEVILGSLLAKEIVTNDGISTIAIDQGILFRLDVYSQEENKYWQSVYNTVLSSFSFVAPESTSVSEDFVEREEVMLEEDVIE